MVKLVCFSIFAFLLLGCNFSPSESSMTIGEVTTLHLRLRREFTKVGFECRYDGPLGYSGALSPATNHLTRWVIVPREGSEVIASLQLETANAKSPFEAMNSVKYGNYLLYYSELRIRDLEGNQFEVETILKKCSENRSGD